MSERMGNKCQISVPNALNKHLWPGYGNIFQAIEQQKAKNRSRIGPERGFRVQTHKIRSWSGENRAVLKPLYRRMSKTHAPTHLYIPTDASSNNNYANRENNESKRVKLPHCVIVKAPGLLDMFYLVEEIAEDLAVSEQDITRYVELGAPHIVDEDGDIWIVGVELADWVACQRKPRREVKLTNDQAYCHHCQKDVLLNDPETTPVMGRLITIRGSCSICGCIIARRGCK